MKHMNWRIAIAALIILILSTTPVMGLTCESPGLDAPFPGWEMRFNGTVTAGAIIEDGYQGVFGMDSLSVKVVQIFSGGFVNVEVSKEGDKIGTFSVPNRVAYNDFLSLKDVRIWANSIGSNTANITVFTHDRAAVNITAYPDYPGTRNYSFPGEEIDLDLVIKNTGELMANDLTLTHEFGEVEVVSAEELPVQGLCPDSSVNLTYKIQAPAQIREDFNYTIYFNLDYSDYNNQLLTAGTYKKKIPLEIVIKALNLSLEKSSGDWSLANFGRELRVTNTIRNNGNVSAFNIELIDLPPFDFEVVSGTPSRRISYLDPGEEKEFTYTVISNDPISCKTMSKIKYDDEFGNNYTQISNLANTTFSPAIKVTKTFRSGTHEGFSFGYPFRTRHSMGRNYSNQAVEDVITLIPSLTNQSRNTTWRRFGEKEIPIDRQGTNITVEVENIGIAVAYDLRVWETLNLTTNQTPPLTFIGPTQWNGSLDPGQSVSYNFTIIPGRARQNYSAFTSINYSDIDHASLNKSYYEDIKGFIPGVCTKKLKTQSRNLTATYRISVPSAKVNLTAPINRSKNETTLKVYEDSAFPLNSTITNNGTERVYDLEYELDTGNFSLIKGQERTFYDSLDPGETIVQNLTLWSPFVENKTLMTINVTLKYRDIFGEEFKSSGNQAVLVHPAKGAFIIVRAERTNLSLELAYANESEIDEPVHFDFILRNTGFGALENITMNLSLPERLQVVTNNTNWSGRIDAQIRTPTDTQYILVGNVSWSGALFVGEKVNLPLRLSGSRSGFYKIPYRVDFDGKELSGVVDFKVKGPVLIIEKTIQKNIIFTGERTNISIFVTNIGDGPAFNVEVEDDLPFGITALGRTSANYSVFNAGEMKNFTYGIFTNISGNQTLGRALVEWDDALGNRYTQRTGTIELLIKTRPPPKTEPPVTNATNVTTPTPEPTPGPSGLSQLLAWFRESPKQAATTTALTLIVLVLMIKILTLTRPIKE